MIAFALLGAATIATLACGAGPRSREVCFRTADGGTVVADLYAASGSDAVVLAHGAAFDKRARTAEVCSRTCSRRFAISAARA
jgi:hypothetical protein